MKKGKEGKPSKRNPFQAGYRGNKGAQNEGLRQETGVAPQVRQQYRAQQAKQRKGRDRHAGQRVRGERSKQGGGGGSVARAAKAGVLRPGTQPVANIPRATCMTARAAATIELFIAALRTKCSTGRSPRAMCISGPRSSPAAHAAAGSLGTARPAAHSQPGRSRARCCCCCCCCWVLARGPALQAGRTGRLQAAAAGGAPLRPASGRGEVDRNRTSTGRQASWKQGGDSN